MEAQEDADLSSCLSLKARKAVVAVLSSAKEETRARKSELEALQSAGNLPSSLATQSYTDIDRRRAQAAAAHEGWVRRLGKKEEALAAECDDVTSKIDAAMEALKAQRSDLAERRKSHADAWESDTARIQQLHKVKIEEMLALMATKTTAAATDSSEVALLRQQMVSLNQRMVQQESLHNQMVQQVKDQANESHTKVVAEWRAHCSFLSAQNPVASPAAETPMPMDTQPPASKRKAESTLQEMQDLEQKVSSPQPLDAVTKGSPLAAQTDSEAQAADEEERKTLEESAKQRSRSRSRERREKKEKERREAGLGELRGDNC